MENKTWKMGKKSTRWYNVEISHATLPRKAQMTFDKCNKIAQIVQLSSIDGPFYSDHLNHFKRNSTMDLDNDYYFCLDVKA
jgi:hypothetical protein